MHDLSPRRPFYQAELQPVVRELFTNCEEIASANQRCTICRRGDRSTKLAAASPSGGGLNYSPFAAPLFALPLSLAKRSFRAAL
jgi:hypothetical protein